MVNNWYACEEYTRAHQAELEGEAARAASARAALRMATDASIRSLVESTIGAALRGARLMAALAGRRGRTHRWHIPRGHLPHRHAPAAR